MQKIFVNSDSTQLVAFVAKVVIGLKISQVASLISFSSNPKALIFIFFGSFGNLFALANNVRWYSSVQKHRSEKQSIRANSWFIVIVEISMATAVLVRFAFIPVFRAQRSHGTKTAQKNLIFTDVHYRKGNGF